MKLGRMLIGTFIAAAALASLGARDQKGPRDLTVHEWGTFLAVLGSDGAALEGMYHEEHALPDFVHSRARDQLHLPSVRLKGETPVIYFYTDRRQQVEVEVGFPSGIWTHWYPQAAMVRPGLAEGSPPPQVQNGRILWLGEVIPVVLGDPPPQVPPASRDSLWRFARDVDAAYVRTLDRARRPNQNEYERFIFYRGLGKSELPLEVAQSRGGTLTWRDREPARHVFVLRIQDGKGAYRYFPRLSAGESLAAALPPEEEGRPLEEFRARISEDLAARLVECGLYPKEAQAMVNTWRVSYFHSEGTRVLFVLPADWTDRAIPLRIHPQPLKTVRVMVGRLEVLTPEREKAAEAAVRDLASREEPARRQAFERLRNEGRYVEPVLRRVLQVTGDEGVRTLCRRLLLTDFVTELRSAVHSAADGSRVVEDRDHVRALLSSLLREVGLREEAGAEARAALQALQLQKPPPASDDRARHYLRAQARVREGLGDERGAAEWYEKLIRFAGQVKERKQCVACHDGGSGPRDMAWFRDWWAGKRFAGHLAGPEGLAGAIALREAALDREPRDAGTRLVLAYLYQAKGDRERAEAMWTGLGAGPRKPRELAAGVKP